MGHVANVVGGVQEINLYYGDASRRFFPNAADYQQQAVSFLLEHALTTPTSFITEDIVGRLTAEGTAQRVLSAQTAVLSSLISSRRVARLAEISKPLPTPRIRRPNCLLTSVMAYSTSWGSNRRTSIFIGATFSAHTFTCYPPT